MAKESKMKNLIFTILLFTSVAVAHEYDFRDLDGFTQATVESEDGTLIIRDLDGFTVLTVDTDGVVRNADGFSVGDVE